MNRNGSVLCMQAVAGLTVMVLWTAAYARSSKAQTLSSEQAGYSRSVTRNIYSLKGVDLCTQGRLASAACLNKLP